METKLEQKAGETPKTMRERLKMHSTNPSCATCHKMFEPMGLAMENFDAVGQWRTTEVGSPIDPVGIITDGTRIDGIKGLRDLSIRKRELFTEVVIEKLLTYYPKKDYWIDLLGRIQSKPGYSERLSLNLYRLKFALGQITRTNDFMEMSQLSLQAGYPAEAIKIIEQGYKAGALGAGTEAERHKRLRDLANKNLAESKASAAANEAEANQSKDGTGLVPVAEEPLARSSDWPSP